MTTNNKAAILNFSHPLTPEQLVDFQADQGVTEVEVIQIKTQFDWSKPFEMQVNKLFKGVDLSHLFDSYGYGEMYVVLPALGVIASAVTIWLESYFEEYPRIIRIEPVVSEFGTTYRYAQVIEAYRIVGGADSRRRSDRKNGEHAPE